MTSISQLPAGARLTAALLQGVAPDAVIKGADEQVLNSTTLQNDDALFLALPANTSWLFECFLDYEGATQGSGDLKWQWTGPSGATLAMTYLFYPVSGGFGANVNLGAVTGLSTARTTGTDGAGTKLGLIMRGTVVMGGTAGTLQFQWAQNTANNSVATIVHTGSYLSLWQVS